MVPIWVDVMLVHWIVILFFQFQSHIVCLKACDELFANRYPYRWQVWWNGIRPFVHRHSLGLYFLCLYTFVSTGITDAKDKIEWMKFFRDRRKTRMKS